MPQSSMLTPALLRSQRVRVRRGILGATLLLAMLGLTSCGGADDSRKGNGGGAGQSGAGPGAGQGAGQGAGGDSGASGSAGLGSQAGASGTGVGADLDVTPTDLQILDVTFGTNEPKLSFSALRAGSPVNVGWSVDRGEVATLSARGPASEVELVPSGKVSGTVTITAGFQGQLVTREVLVRVSGTQNGVQAGNAAQAKQVASDVASLTAGGGVGGVGGEGLGSAVSDQAVLTALAAPSGDGSAEDLRFLYPYDETVFPRGMSAPLLMWDWTTGDADAIRIELSTKSGSFNWNGTFGRPEILAQTGGKFVRHPIPQDVWAAATDSAGATSGSGARDDVIVKLVVASGGQAFGPIQRTVRVAPARLSGTIYYHTYGTLLAKNYPSNGLSGDFGAAVLSIRVGDDAPQVVSGQTECRTCHSVSQTGSRLVAQDEDFGTHTSELTPAGAGPESLVPTQTQDNNTEFPGLYPDGSFLLTRIGTIVELPSTTASTPTGLADIATRMGPQSFSPDGTLVVFNPITRPGVANANQQLVVTEYANATRTFSNARVVFDATGQDAPVRPGWPSFLPDTNLVLDGMTVQEARGGVVFQRQTVAPTGDGNNWEAPHTRKGTKSQIWWTTVSDGTNARSLDLLNGLSSTGSYLPALAQGTSMTCTADGVQVGGMNADHSDDVNHNYEPNVSPIAAGGYAWVIFTSRRLYGNVATIPPFCSDPRGVDLRAHITPKKLWVAAVDLGAKPGTDPSHPAFYLPAQELLAGNARGIWVQDPCRNEGASCDSGDQCCGGFCRPDGEDGALVCSDAPPDATCSMTGEKCTESTDCCEPSDECIAGYCAVIRPD